RDFHVTGVQTCALPISREQSLIGSQINLIPVNNGSIDSTDIAGDIRIKIERRIDFNTIDTVIQTHPDVILLIFRYPQYGVVLQSVILIYVLYEFTFFVDNNHAILDGSKGILIFVQINAVVDLSALQLVAGFGFPSLYTSISSQEI